MGHSHDDFFHPVGWAFLQDRVQGSDETFTAFQRESLLANVTSVEEIFEFFSLYDFTQYPNFLFITEVGDIAVPFHPGLEPTPFFRRL